MFTPASITTCSVEVQW